MVLAVDKFMKISHRHRTRAFDLRQEQVAPSLPKSELEEYANDLRKVCVPVPEIAPISRAIGRAPQLRKK